MSEPLVIPKRDSWKMFDGISRRYDFLNRVLSLGQDIAWRKQLLKHLPAKDRLTVLDLATGTADVLITLAKHNPRFDRGFGIDMAVKMLDIGRAKIKAEQLTDKILLQHGDAQALPFLEETFDCVTISFGIRNIPDLRKALLEMHRVTKKGGRIIILEFAHPSNPILRVGHWVYMRSVVPMAGLLFSGNWKAYQYLNQTVAQFPYGERFVNILKQFGFKNVTSQPLMDGVAIIYSADK